MSVIVKSLVPGSLALLLASPLASASTIAWGPVGQITSPSNLDQSGILVSAINAGGNQGPQVVAGTDITFTDGGITAAIGGGNVSNSGNGGWYSPTTGDAGLDIVLDSHSYISDNNPNGRGRVDLTVVPGQQYVIQVIGVADDRTCCAARVQTLDDGLGNTSGSLVRGLANIVTGTFTADGLTQSFFVSGENDPGITAYQLRLVPEPTVLGSVGVAAGLLAFRRRRRET